MAHDAETEDLSYWAQMILEFVTYQGGKATEQEIMARFGGKWSGLAGPIKELVTAGYIVVGPNPKGLGRAVWRL